mgnify:CR=1 FL=1
MVKVITYGTYDLLHYGHIRLLKRAKALGDYLIVGVTADDFDKTRGKINVQQSLMERIEAVRATGLADKIIVEEYEGQKIDDIRRYDVDIFTVGSDWKGKFDYLKEYCKVIYLERTEGVSSSEIREEERQIRLGMVGSSSFLNKVFVESAYVNGIHINAMHTENISKMCEDLKKLNVKSYNGLLSQCDAIYIRSKPEDHYSQIVQALNCGKHILCEAPIGIDKIQTEELLELARKKGLTLMTGIKTAYATAFSRLLLLVKTGKIGEAVSVDAVCTSLSRQMTDWTCIYEWGPTALLPILEILGTNIQDYRIISTYHEDFIKIDILYKNATASIKIGDGVKSEGSLVISGTKGYIYVPAPWWKTDYFEIRYEDQTLNKRYFYELDGEGIRYELLSFAKAIANKKTVETIQDELTIKISELMGAFYQKNRISFI